MELLTVIAIVGIMTAMTIAKYNSFKVRTKISVASQELLFLRSAFYLYLGDNEQLPRDVKKGIIPAGMESYVPSSIFSDPTPVGGYYNWDGLPNHDPPGISIQDPDFSNDEMILLDKYIDDGNLSSGQFRTTHDGHYKLIIEP